MTETILCKVNLSKANKTYSPSIEIFHFLQQSQSHSLIQSRQPCSRSVQGQVNPQQQYEMTFWMPEQHLFFSDPSVLPLH